MDALTKAKGKATLWQAIDVGYTEVPMDIMPYVEQFCKRKRSFKMYDRVEVPGFRVYKMLYYTKHERWEMEIPILEADEPTDDV